MRVAILEESLGKIRKNSMSSDEKKMSKECRLINYYWCRFCMKNFIPDDYDNPNFCCSRKCESLLEEYIEREKIKDKDGSEIKSVIAIDNDFIDANAHFEQFLEKMHIKLQMDADKDYTLELKVGIRRDEDQNILITNKVFKLKENANPIDILVSDDENKISEKISEFIKAQENE